MPDTTHHSRLYFDNAATSYPKPRAVLEAMQHYATALGASPGRGSYHESIEAGALITSCRQRLCSLINGQSHDHVVFTLNCTDALNLAIRGVVLADTRRPRHIITTELDHNSILRPFNELCRQEHITQTRVPVDPKTGLVDPKRIEDAIRRQTCLIATLHASNVTGTMQDIGAIGRIAQRRGVLFLVDAAQSLGHCPIDVQQMNIDLLAAPGHKGLLGPLGTGVLYIRPEVEKAMITVREGGTGSVSERDTQPGFMPDRFESGSHNTLGLVGLSEGVNHILERGVQNTWAHEQSLVKTMIESLTEWGEMPGLKLYGPPTVKDRCGVFSIGIEGLDPHELSAILESEYGILTRSGLHCAPGAHRTIGSMARGGTTRLSFGPYLQPQDVKYAADALGQICHRLHHGINHAAERTGA